MKLFTCIRFFMPVLSTRLRLLTGASSLRDFSTKPEKFFLNGNFGRHRMLLKILLLLLRFKMRMIVTFKTSSDFSRVTLGTSIGQSLGRLLHSRLGSTYCYRIKVFGHRHHHHRHHHHHHQHHHQHRHHQHQRHQHRRHQHTWSDDTEGLLPSPPLECEATPKAALGVFFILNIHFHIFTLYFRGVSPYIYTFIHLPYTFHTFISLDNALNLRSLIRKRRFHSWNNIKTITGHFDFEKCNRQEMRIFYIYLRSNRLLNEI